MWGIFFTNPRPKSQNKKTSSQISLMKVNIRKNQTLIKKITKTQLKKPANIYNCQGEGGEAHWPAHGGRDEVVLRL
jgi:hypothetical protein